MLLLSIEVAPITFIVGFALDYGSEYYLHASKQRVLCTLSARTLSTISLLHKDDSKQWYEKQMTLAVI